MAKRLSKSKLSRSKSSKPSRFKSSASRFSRPNPFKSKSPKSPKSPRFRLHRSFKRSYREDYDRPFEAPGLIAHAVATFKLIFKNWKVFLPLVFLIAVLNVAFVGLMNEDTFVAFQKSVDETTDGLKNGELGFFARSGLLLISTITTGGLSTGMTDTQQVFAILLFLITWLVTIYLIRQFLAGHKPRLRDGLYNALSPLISTVIVTAVIFVEAIPIMIVIITYAAAVSTQFLSTPFYALIYVIFAVLMILLSVYLISSSLVALIAVSAPGLYPFVAIRTASELLAGRRTKFVIRIIYLIIVIAIMWVIIMTPLIALDLWLKSSIDWLAGIPFVSIELLLMSCFTAVYATTYLYLFYRRLLDYDDTSSKATPYSNQASAKKETKK